MHDKRISITQGNSTQSNQTPKLEHSVPLIKGKDLLIIVTLLIGGVVLPVLGWIIALVLLVKSDSWSLKAKLIGALAPPIGYFPLSVILLMPSFTNSCVNAAHLNKHQTISCATAVFSYSGVEIIAIALLAILPALNALYLYKSAKKTFA